MIWCKSHQTELASAVHINVAFEELSASNTELIRRALTLLKWLSAATIDLPNRASLLNVGHEMERSVCVNLRLALRSELVVHGLKLGVLVNELSQLLGGLTLGRQGGQPLKERAFWERATDLVSNVHCRV